jgi:hypothetical protein
MQQLEPLCHEHFAQGGHAGDISSRSVEAADKAKPDRIAAGVENDRNRRRCRLGGDRCSNAGSDQDRHRNANQLRSERWQAIVATIRPAIFDCDVAALDKTSLVKAPAERGQEGRVFVG